MQSRLTKILPLFCVTVALLLAITACGSNNGGSGTQAPTNTQPQTSQPQQEQTTPNDVASESQTENRNSNDTSVGDTITFGEYDWRILDIQNGNALIISDRVLFNSYFHTSRENLSWEESFLRQHLNDDFYNSFSESDRNRIVETLLTNRLDTLNEDDEKQYDNETLDKIFLLSDDEVNEFMSGHNDVRRVWHIETGSLENWWLRTVTATMLDGRQQVLRVNGNGSTVTSNVNGPGNQGDGVGVRPAMWIRL